MPEAMDGARGGFKAKTPAQAPDVAVDIPVEQGRAIPGREDQSRAFDIVVGNEPEERLSEFPAEWDEPLSPALAVQLENEVVEINVGGTEF